MAKRPLQRGGLAHRQNHYGSLLGGHYTAYTARTDDDGKVRWFEFDDSRVTACDEADVQVRRRSLTTGCPRGVAN